MRTHFERPAPIPTWIAGISICFFVVLGMVAIGRSIPASYASIPDERALSKHEAATSGSKDAQVDLAVARGTIAPRNRARCPDCGVIESMRQIGRSRGVGGKDTDVKVAGGISSGVSGSAIAANAITGKGYEITVRFRDGGTTVFNEATPRTWRSGSRVIVIGRSNASYN